MDLTTCLWFNGRAREAAVFYTSIFPIARWLKDKFGVSWQVIAPEMGKYLGGSDSEGSQRATQAMLGMMKIDLAVMKKAYEGSN